jgi:serine/threonine protein kinase
VERSGSFNLLDFDQLEVKIVQGLHHEKIGKIYEAAIVDCKLHILMEYADAGEFYHVITRQTHLLPENTILDIFARICLAVKSIHGDIVKQGEFVDRNSILYLTGKLHGTVMRCAVCYLGS